ncbi:metal-dependent hydrolase [Parendozoicomonas sp. Alg238-R29]|uniref:metal-dependent hydrolase n=1 Tax=Parendozoicomonas sp. Alg238-R29 TaxID=2993446 RepID=UPI00248D7F3A|nr:metal-dependent hydrolase [Parendozoicomonas sp. Alg238-R29]
MASFQTHLIVASTLTGALSVTALYADLVTPVTAMILWGIGTLSGLLPDIDSESSLSLQLLSSLFLVAVAAVMVNHLSETTPLLWNLATVTGTLLALRLMIIPLCSKIMVHRGNCHSLLAALATSLSTIFISIHFLSVPVQTGYMMGLFAGTGFIIHLILDELYSINIGKGKVKKSFGSAIKPFARKSPTSSVVMTALCAAELWWLPEPQSLQVVLQRLVQTSWKALS